MKHSKYINLTFQLCLFSCLSSVLSFGDIIHVPDQCTTIQSAIDMAVNGDTILVGSGLYRGAGNINLNFKGKAITVIGVNPESENNDCKAIIDTEDHGVIVRFINDEGPDTVFSCFTLIGGDLTPIVRGVPGFFEFSQDAMPIITNITVGQCDSCFNANNSHIYELNNSTYNNERIWELLKDRIWNGNNPFKQPFNTTDYYGSGDLDLDGKVTLDDVNLVSKILDGLESPCSRADVNGDGIVTSKDVDLINLATSGQPLLGNWNKLTSRSERESWINKMLSIDKTDEHPYLYWYKCLDFSVQLYINCAHYRQEILDNYYDGGQTKYNLPVYIVSALGKGYGHSLNGILVGDDPLDFNDWQFIEPQNDRSASPGSWNLPYGTKIKIQSVKFISGSGYLDDTKVIFRLNKAGCKLIKYSEDIIRKRSKSQKYKPINNIDIYNPRILPLKGGRLLFERYRDNMSRTTDVHLGNAMFENNFKHKPIIVDSWLSRLLDIYRSNDGMIHIIWTGKNDYKIGVLHGILDASTGKVGDITRVSLGHRKVRMGRILVTDNGVVNVFWAENKTNESHLYKTGIYWSQLQNGKWNNGVNLSGDIGFLKYIGWADSRNGDRNIFDVAISNDIIMLVWTDWGKSGHIGGSKLHYKVYESNRWSKKSPVDNKDDRKGLKLCTSSDGIIHLVHVRNGNLNHLKYINKSWSNPLLIECEGIPEQPWLTPGRNKDIVYLIFEETMNEQTAPAWNKYSKGKWKGKKTISIPKGCSVSRPSIQLLPSGCIYYAYSLVYPEYITAKRGNLLKIKDTLKRE